MHRVKNLLFLGYDESKTTLINALKGKNINVDHTDEYITWSDEYDLIVSFGYRYIIKPDQIMNSSAPILNLHIAYLPWNKGSHPNFWSHFDCTPSGVTIHLIDDGIDTGPIAFQKYVNFSKDEITFADTYCRLLAEVEKLFLENIDSILSLDFELKPQRRQGTFHKSSDLPSEFIGWQAIIYNEINRLDSLLTAHPNE